ncbi:MAG: response regulator [Desulfobulbaceae bacterium]|jgi:two-component system cell cycle response regulator DivK|nr:response regulator [Desulfobulbaceae bacterium]
MKKVLVVEDNPENLRLITYVLTRGGYEVIAATSGEEGVEMARSEHPCFILMDIQLPGITGMEAARQLQDAGEGRAIPIIAVTSYAQKGDRQKAIDAGCNGYIEKPYDPLTIMAEIHKIIGDSE